MMNLNRASAWFLAGLSMVGLSSPAWSLGFGRPTSRAILGEALSVSVPLRLEAGEDLGEECLAADVFYGDDKLSQTAVNASMSAAGAAGRTVRVTTTAPINEPVVTVYLVVGCKVKITRKFVAFADPPGIVSLPSQTAEVAPVLDSSIQSSKLAGLDKGLATSSSRISSSRDSTTSQASSAANGAANGAAPATQAGDGAPMFAATPKSITALGSPRKKRSRQTDTLSARVDERPREAARSRLLLDPAAADAMVEPMLIMSSSMAQAADANTAEAAERRAAAAALWAAMNASPEQLARDRQRMQELEQRLARLQQDSAGVQQKVIEMQARVQDAESRRFNHPLVYGLIGACLLMAAALAWLFLRQRRLQQLQGDWWRGEETPQGPDTAPAAMSEPSLVLPGSDFMAGRSSTAARQLDGLAKDHATPKATVPVSSPTGLVGARALSSGIVSGIHAPVAAKSRVEPGLSTTQALNLKPQESVREMTVEELIDLEQQAEFFVVLGQDDAAIELLESHIKPVPGASPLPYLKLLEIYQRLGRKADYERVQSVFNGRFNAYAPSWESDLQQGHALQDYPGVVERLQSLWSQPAQAMDVLQRSLIRPDDSQETFDLPAYRELLFLYAVARDLSERQVNDPVSVDLALVDDLSLVESGAHRVEPLLATRPVKAVPQPAPSLSLDLSLDDPVEDPQRPAN